MKCSLGISNFLEEISSLSHSTIFLYFFTPITEEGSLVSPCYSLVLCQPRQHIKNRDITLPTEVHLVKAMVFPVVMYGYKSWTIKKYEHWRIDAFELWCCIRLLSIPWTARRSNQWILKEISPEYSLEELMLKLKLQYFGYLMQRADSLEKTLMLGKIKGGRSKGWQTMRYLDGITNSMDISLSREAWHAAVCGVTKSWTHWANELKWNVDITGKKNKNFRGNHM